MIFWHLSQFTRYLIRFLLVLEVNVPAAVKRWLRTLLTLAGATHIQIDLTNGRKSNDPMHHRKWSWYERRMCTTLNVTPHQNYQTTVGFTYQICWFHLGEALPSVDRLRAPAY
jgi:hypothetical protein